jgi:biotin carboxyl carrier protein
MSSELSLSQILANMEAQIASFQEREAFHAEQEVFHREQRAVMAAELAAVLQSYEAFKAVAGTAAEIASRTASAAPPRPQEEMPSSTVRSKLVGQVVADLPAGEVFSATEISAKVNRRYGKHLRKPATPRMVSTALRRLTDEGEVRLVQKGTPHHEALYTKA